MHGKTNKRFIGIDPSLSETGVVLLEKGRASQPKCIKMKPKNKHGELIPLEERIDRIIEDLKW